MVRTVGFVAAAWLAAGLFAAPGASAQNSASINLAGIQLRNAVDVARDSAPQTIVPATRYRTQVSGMVRGAPVFSPLWLLFPTATPLAQVLETLAPGSSQMLDSYGDNPTNPPTHPFTAANQTMSGSTVIGGTTVNYSLTLQAGIRADNVAFFSLTNVVLTPTSIGYLVFDSGAAVITRIPCPVDVDGNGAPEPADIAAFVNTWVSSLSAGTRAGDFDLDGAVTPADVAVFVSRWLATLATGCPT